MTPDRPDERAAFEAWHEAHQAAADGAWRMRFSISSPAGEACWSAWQARAARAQPLAPADRPTPTLYCGCGQRPCVVNDPACNARALEPRPAPDEPVSGANALREAHARDILLAAMRGIEDAAPMLKAYLTHVRAALVDTAGPSADQSPVAQSPTAAQSDGAVASAVEDAPQELPISNRSAQGLATLPGVQSAGPSAEPPERMRPGVYEGKLRNEDYVEGWNDCIAAPQPVHAEPDEPSAVAALRDALERTLGNFRLMLAQKPVRDAAETIAEAERALVISHQKD